MRYRQGRKLFLRRRPRPQCPHLQCPHLQQKDKTHIGKNAQSYAETGQPFCFEKQERVLNLTRQMLGRSRQRQSLSQWSSSNFRRFAPKPVSTCSHLVRRIGMRFISTENKSGTLRSTHRYRRPIQIAVSIRNRAQVSITYDIRERHRG